MIIISKLNQGFSFHKTFTYTQRAGTLQRTMMMTMTLMITIMQWVGCWFEYSWMDNNDNSLHDNMGTPE
jgi:hypothetical protein